MRRRAGQSFCAFLVALALASAPASFAQTAEPAAWPFAASDIAPDPRVTYGALPNGMRYALLPNRAPPGAVSIRLVVDFGSFNETDDEKGLAHFIEHLAFNGTKNVPEGEMAKRLERLGLEVGPDVNAVTGRSETIYSLDLPNASKATVGEALFLAREIASEVTFDAEALERERGVVLAELRSNDTFAQRRTEQKIGFLLPGAYAASRMPLGDPSVVASAKRDALVSLYRRYYRPERAILVVAGDIDVSELAGAITQQFADWRGVGPPGEDRSAVAALEQRQPASSVFVHEAGGDSVSVYSLTPFEAPSDSVTRRREADLLAIASGALGKRLAALAAGEDPPFRSAGLAYVSIVEAADAASGFAVVTPGKWKRGVQALEQEWRRALLYGFSQAEVDEQVAAIRTGRTNAALRETSRTTSELIAQLTGAIVGNVVFTTPSSSLARFEAFASEATPDKVSEVFRRRLKVETPLFFVSASRADAGLDAGVLAAWRESAARPVAPVRERATGRFAYTDFGRPGRVVKDARIDSVDTRIVTFANNVRLNVRRSKSETNAVMVSVRVAGGEVALAEAPLGLTSLMSAFSAGGLERHSADDLRSLMAGHAVQVAFGATTTAFGGVYRTTPADLDLQLRLAAAYLTHPGYRPEAERRWRENNVLSWPLLTADAQTLLASRGMRILASGDRRVGVDPDDGAIYRSFVELRAWLDPFLKDGAIEIAIVGDIDEDTAIAAVAKTFGALPRRKAEWSEYQVRQPLKFRTARDPIVLEHDGERDQALVNLFWPVAIDPDRDPQAVRVLSALMTVMGLKVIDRVREELGASYSPSASGLVSAIHPGWGYVTTNAEVKPEDADRVLGALKQVAADLRDGRITQDELDRAITPALEQLPSHTAYNGYWLSVISEAQTRPDRMAQGLMTEVTAGLKAITAADVVAAANRWLAEESVQEVRVIPARASAAGGSVVTP